MDNKQIPNVPMRHPKSNSKVAYKMGEWDTVNLTFSLILDTIHVREVYV